MELEPQKKLATTEAPEILEAEELFVVDGLDGDSPEQDLFSLMAQGAAEAHSPLDLPEDSDAIAELAQASNGIEQSVELCAVDGEAVAVEPPPAEMEMAVESTVECEESPAPARMFVLRPWMAAAAAAMLVGGVGISLKLLIPASIKPVDLGTTAEIPSPAVIPMMDASCERRAEAPTEKLGAFGVPSVSEPIDWAIAQPVPAGELNIAPTVPPQVPVDPNPPAAAVETGKSNPTNPEAPEHPANLAGLPGLDPVATTPAPAGIPKGAAGKGAEVFVKLRNGSLFNGKLEKLTTSEAKIRVEKGEIEFSMAELDVILPIAQAPANRGPEAIIQLQNGNRLAGRLSEDLQNRVVLAVGASEVVIKRAEILKIELRPPLGLIFDLEKQKAQK
ncbi:MAG: hypothetical protein HY286_15265 [Planctomycetes bacterium]|nr:hypothetical protein [Planctomycetota bacterium]